MKCGDFTNRTDKPKELLAANPNGKVPAFIDGDVAMFEGCAILHYLLDHYDFDRDKIQQILASVAFKFKFGP